MFIIKKNNLFLLKKKNIIGLIFFIMLLVIAGCKAKNNISSFVPNEFPIHKNIIVTCFWIGEPADSENGYISNYESAWDINWLSHYGGEDDPTNRNGFYPASFIPKENSFYFALPYDDFDSTGNRRQNAFKEIYWSKEKSWSAYESICKNHWIKIIKGSKIVYAQWEDCGPFYYDDFNYVFGTSQPLNQTLNNSSGLDVSPAVRDYLGISGLDKVDWQFVDSVDVPNGPWKIIVTTSQVDWGQ